MKKLFALMLALCLCMAAPLASAEQDTELLEAPTVSFDAKTVIFAPDGLGLMVPSNAEVVFTEDSTLQVQVPDIALSMTVAFVPEELSSIITRKETQGYNVFNFTAKEITYIVTGIVADGESTANAMITMGDAVTLVITFVYPASYTGSVVPEILSTLGYYEN